MQCHFGLIFRILEFWNFGAPGWWCLWWVRLRSAPAVTPRAFPGGRQAEFTTCTHMSEDPISSLGTLYLLFVSFLAAGLAHRSRGNGIYQQCLLQSARAVRGAWQFANIVLPGTSTSRENPLRSNISVVFTPRGRLSVGETKYSNPALPPRCLVADYFSVLKVQNFCSLFGIFLLTHPFESDIVICQTTPQLV